MEAILVALITGGLSLLGVVITNMMAARRAEQRMVTAQAVTDARLEELTREVRAHNNFAQRVPVLEEQLRVANHRLSSLEKAHTHGSSHFRSYRKPAFRRRLSGCWHFSLHSP